MSNKDRELERLEGLYRKGLTSAGVKLFDARATLTGPNTVRLADSGQEVSAQHILIAVGGRPVEHPALPGAEHCIYSNEVFDLETLPKRIVIAGAGYIGIEFANIFHGLGVQTALLYRGQEILSGFDDDIRAGLRERMQDRGIDVRLHTIMHKIEKAGNGVLSVHLSDDQVLEADQVMLAIGRLPNTQSLGLESAGVETDERGAILVDEYSKTSADNIYAVGDVTNRVQLTPVAIHESMCLIDTLYHGKPTVPDYDTIPTAVFSQPEIGTVGLTESDAVSRYGDIDVYRAEFRPMKNVLPGRNEKMIMKMLVDATSNVVVGVHVLGPDAGELAQILGVVLKARLKKSDFDATMALHPSAAEELVTMYQPTYRFRGGERLS